VKPITENIIEESAIEILQSEGWEYVNGKEISPEGLFCERENFSEVVLVKRLREAIAKINPNIPADAQEAAVQKVLRIASPDLLHNNEEFHRQLIEKVKIPYQQNGYESSHEVALIDFENPPNNQFLIVNHKNLAIELLKKILNDELKIRAKTNLVKSKKLLEMLETAIKKYQNNLLTTAEIIQELINIAKQIKDADKEGEKLGLNNDEVAFYNALEINDSAVQVLGDDTLKEIAREIADKVRANTTIDWTIRESARAKLMVLVKRTLNKYGYPPDKQAKAIDTVLKQAELLADFWADGK